MLCSVKLIGFQCQAVSWREMDEKIEKLRSKIEAAQKAAKAQLVAQKLANEKKKPEEGRC